MYRRNRGFTIVEIAVVVAALSIIMTIIIVTFNGAQQRSRDNRRTADAIVLMTALNSYYNDNGLYPAPCPGGDNSACSITTLSGYLVPKYIPSIPSDPSGNTGQYVRGMYPNKSYGLLINYETTTPCKTGIDFMGNFTVNGSSNTWWGPVSTVPICTNPPPNAA